MSNSYENPLDSERVKKPYATYINLFNKAAINAKPLNKSFFSNQVNTPLLPIQSNTTKQNISLRARC